MVETAIRSGEIVERERFELAQRLLGGCWRRISPTG
jgi:hypothetical protein